MIEQMLLDETVQIGLAARNAVVQGVEFGNKIGGQWTPGVSCPDENVGAWVMRQIAKLWEIGLEHIVSAQVYGWSACEVVWERSEEYGGLWEISRIESRHAADTEVLIADATGYKVGVRIKNVKNVEQGYVDLRFPLALFHSYKPGPGEHYGGPVLLGAYRPWADKHLDGGAIDVRRLFMHKDAYGGADLSYPDGFTDIGTPEEPNEVPNREIARQIIEQIEAGGVTTTPSQYDEHGNKLWHMERATVPSNPQHILQYPAELDGEMLRGMQVPDGVLKADDAGSWQGRLIPMGIMYASLDPWVTSILCDIRQQLLEPGMMNNWGKVIPFLVGHKPLAEQAMDQQRNPSMGGMPMDGGGMQMDDGEQYAQDEQQEGDPARMGLGLDAVAAVGEGVLSTRAVVNAALMALDRPELMSAHRAPKGYTKAHPLRIGGNEYYGGEYIPGDIVAQATPEQKREIEEGRKEGVNAPAEKPQMSPGSMAKHSKHDAWAKTIATARKIKLQSGHQVQLQFAKRGGRDEYSIVHKAPDGTKTAYANTFGSGNEAADFGAKVLHHHIQSAKIGTESEKPENVLDRTSGEDSSRGKKPDARGSTSDASAGEPGGSIGGTGGPGTGLRDDNGGERATTGSDAEKPRDASGDDSRVGERPTIRDTFGVAAAVEEAVTAVPAPEAPTDLSAGNFRYTNTEFIQGGLKTKFRQNIAALQTMRQCQDEGRQPTPAEAETISKFVGWGQFPALFNSKYGYDNDALKRENRQKEIDPTFEKGDWRKEQQLLRSMLTDEEFESARGSILNAHYTHPDIVKAHWDMARKLGFDGGRFLETSAGIGYYIGMMPNDLASRTRSSAVELDDTTGTMLKQLYPAADVQIKGFEQHNAPDNFYGLVASNVPFGAYKVADPRYDKFNANIHDYFFLKSADLTQPGGLIMHITSTGTLDKPDSKIRDELAEKCELVAAVRFPGDAHKENAGTSVVTDMLILRKKVPGESPLSLEHTPSEAEPKQPGFTGITTDSLGRVYHWRDGKRVPGPKWTEVTQVADPDGGDDITVNRYFAENPNHILGRLDRTGTMRASGEDNVSAASPEELSQALGRQVHVEIDPETKKRKFLFEDGTPVPASDRRKVGEEQFKAKLGSFIESLPTGVYHPVRNSRAAFEPSSMPAPDDVREGGYKIVDGKLFQRVGGALVEREANKSKLARIEGQLGILSAARSTINAQLEGRDASGERDALNAAYDAFVEQHGPIHDRANKLAMKEAGDDFFFLQSLENYDATKKLATKADIFSKDTVRHVASMEHADSISDAVGASLHEFGSLNIDHMSKITGKSVNMVAEELASQGIAFEDPALGWQQAAHYLSGNVRRKLVEAQAAAAADPKFQRNVDALLAVQPEDKDFTEIAVQLGTPWVPGSDVQAFAAETLQIPETYLQVSHAAVDGAHGGWKARWTPEGAKRNRKGKMSSLAEWETSGVGFMDMLNAALTGKKIEVRGGEDEYTDADGTVHPILAVDADGNEVVNRKATADVAAKVQELKDKFADWIWGDDERTIRLARYYNDNFNNIRELQYDGSHQTFPGMNPAIQLHPHIPNFAWRVVTNGTALAAHEVGTGKTFAMIASAMELRRLGLAKKPCIACLKANIEQITRDAQLLYPGARILSTEGQFTAAKRKEMVSRIATGDYDIVIMTHDNLNMLKMRPEVEAQYLRDELDQLGVAKRAAEGEKDTRTAKNLETARKNLEAKLQKVLNASGKDDAVHFEDTGIDQLFVDEAHYYKTLPTYSKRNRVKGIPTGRSQRATTMLMRAQWLQNKNGGRGVVFATGTPIDNTMAEMYTMQRYLQSSELKARGISSFDDWASTFGAMETRHEFNVAGQYKPTDRFSKFMNIPELMSIARQTIDVQRADDMKLTPKQADAINDPNRPAGSPVILRPKKVDQESVSASRPEIDALMDNLQSRAAALSHRKGPATKGDDNMLVICTDGRKGAVDLRLLDDRAPDHPDSKTNRCVRGVLDLWKQHPGKTQLIFSDVGVNPSQAESRSADVVAGGADSDEDVTMNEEFDDANLGSSGKFRLYDDIINKLVKGGIPREKIADFSQLKGDEKERAMEKMRSGDIVVALGSTKKLGTGCNVQNKVVAMHHLDVPWTPAALEQRVGRGWRHGNELAKTGQSLLNIPYIQEGSLDKFFWQVVSKKAKFIGQVMAGKTADREAADQDTETLSPDTLMAIASGDPRTMEKVELEDGIRKLKAGHNRHIREQMKFRKLVEEADRGMPEMKEQHERHLTDAAHFESRPDFEMTIGGKSFTKRAEAEEALSAKMTELDSAFDEMSDYSKTTATPYHVGEYRGVPVHYRPLGMANYRLAYHWGFNGSSPNPSDLVMVAPSGEHRWTAPSLHSLEYRANNIGKNAKDLSDFMARNEASTSAIRGKIGQKFAGADELAAKEARLKEVEAALSGGRPDVEQHIDSPVLVKSASKMDEAAHLRRRLAELEGDEPVTMALVPGIVKTFNGRQYMLNQHHRWQRTNQPTPHGDRGHANDQHQQHGPQHPASSEPKHTFDPATGQRIPHTNAGASDKQVGDLHAKWQQSGSYLTDTFRDHGLDFNGKDKELFHRVMQHKPAETTQQAPQATQEQSAEPKETIDQITQRDAVANYEKHRAKYLEHSGMYDESGNLKGVVLNTDEWRTSFPQYTGTNAADVHEASSYLNKRLYGEALQSMKGKGNQRMLILAGGGGSGKGTATRDYFDQGQYPIVLDQASDSYPKLEAKLDEAIANGYTPEHVFIDRGPELAINGIEQRALGLEKRGELPRTVPIKIALEANIKARKATLDLLKRRMDIDVKVVDNTSNEKGDRRLIKDRNEAIQYLERRVADEDKITSDGLEEKLHRNVAHRFLAGDIPEHIAKGLTSHEFIEEAKKWEPPIRQQSTTASSP